MTACQLLLLALLAHESPPATAAPAAIERRVEVDGLDRGYLLYAPADAPAGPRPLVLVFHGEGGTPRSIEEYFGMNRFAEEAGFLVAYPEGLGESWDDGRGVTPPDEATGFVGALVDRAARAALPAGRDRADDVGFIRRVVDEIADRHPVDRARVFATGMSSGGIFCHRLAAEAPGLVAAVAPVSGPIARPLLGTFRLDRPVSFYTIQGDADPIVPIGGGLVYPAGLRDRGAVGSLDQTLAPYLSAAGIAGPPTVRPLADAAPDGTTTERRTYPAGDGGTLVVVDLVHGGGHGLPGRTRDYPEWAVGKTSRDYDGALAIWRFFASCPPLRPAPTADLAAGD